MRDPEQTTQPEILRGETPNPVDVPPGCRFHPRCPIAIPECRDVDPELRVPAAARSGHRVACIRA
jgi:peptide/nickel transport system ATP-binding protein